MVSPVLYEMQTSCSSQTKGSGGEVKDEGEKDKKNNHFQSKKCSMTQEESQAEK